MTAPIVKKSKFMMQYLPPGESESYSQVNENSVLWVL
jgi:hypothetical protein